MEHPENFDRAAAGADLAYMAKILAMADDTNQKETAEDLVRAFTTYNLPATFVSRLAAYNAGEASHDELIEEIEAAAPKPPAEQPDGESLDDRIARLLERRGEFPAPPAPPRR